MRCIRLPNGNLLVPVELDDSEEGFGLAPLPPKRYSGRMDYENRVITGDCLEVLSAMPPATADLVLTDPR